MASDDVDQTPDLVGRQRVGRGRLADERGGQLELAGVPLEALAVEGVAADEVIAEGAGGPDSKLGASIRG